MSHLGETIRMLRIEQNMSQSQLAQAAGVARSYVSMIESGARTNIGTQTLERMAAALGLPAGAILSRVGIALVSLDPLEISPEVRRLAERIDALPPGTHERAITLVDSVVRGLSAAHREQAHAKAIGEMADELS